jgi:hypothetical protein
VWYEQDTTFLLPKLNVAFNIASPFAYFSAHTVNLTRMLVDLLKV